MPYVVGDDCILCGVCVAVCPTGSIQEGELKCFIDVSECIECGTCVETCVSEAILFIEEEVPEPEEKL